MGEKVGKREGFSSGMAVFFATLSSAIGLGNIWLFPYMTGENGGGAFLLIYLLCLLIVGIPVLLAEFYMGRKTQSNSVGAFETLRPKSGWRGVGIVGVCAAYLVMFFYSSVAGWVYIYIAKAIRGDFIGSTAETIKAQYISTINNPLIPIIGQFLVIAIVCGVLIMGVKKGIEGLTKILMPVLFCLIIICDIRALTLSGAWQGMKFLFAVDFSHLSQKAILGAMGLAFFKLSLGTGAMITYASYFTKDNNMIGNAFKVSVADTLVSLLAGLAIFPAVFSFGLSPSEGPGLLFMTIPMVFAKMPLGKILLVAFFMLTAIAATTAMLSLVEVPVAYLCEERKMSRKKAVLFSGALIFVVGALATWSADKGGVLGTFTVFGRTIFDLFSHVYEHILLLLLGVAISIFVGYVVDRNDVKNQLTNGGTLRTGKLLNIYFPILRYVTPILIFIVFLSGLGVFG